MVPFNFLVELSFLFLAGEGEWSFCGLALFWAKADCFKLMHSWGGYFQCRLGAEVVAVDAGVDAADASTDAEEVEALI